MLVSEDDSAMEVNSNAREYEPRPALATGGGVLGKIECCNIVLREEGRCTSHRVDPCGGGCRQNGERIKMMFVLEFAPSIKSSHPPKSAALLSTYILCTKL